MAGAALSLTLGELADRLRLTADRIARINWQPALQKVRLLLLSAARECFDQARAPDGSAWLPLKNPSAKRGGPSSKPLRDKGLLMASVTAQGAGHVEEIGPTSLVIGTNLKYAGVHQFGHTFARAERRRDRPWVFRLPDGKTIFTRRIRAHQQTVPARPFLGWSERSIETTVAILQEHAADQLTV